MKNFFKSKVFISAILGLSTLPVFGQMDTGMCPKPLATTSSDTPKLNLAPSQLKDANGNSFYNLSGFRLILPVNSKDCDYFNYTTDAAVTILPTILGNEANAYQHPNHFYLDENNYLVFNAPANGATTTPGSGSDHVRTELVENYGDKNNGNWYYATGGKLSGDVKIDSVSSVVKIDSILSGGSAIFAQLHAAGAPPFVVVFYKSSNKKIAMYVYDTTTATESFQYKELNGLKLDLHQFFHYELKFGPDSGNNVELTVSGLAADGSGTTTVSAKVPFNQDNWKNTLVRFTLGAYQNTSNQNVWSRAYTDQTTNYTQVTYKAFKIEHPTSIPQQ